jgi:hypothetical protein
MPRRIAQQNPKVRVIVREFEKDVFEILSIMGWHAWNGIEAVYVARSVGVRSSGLYPIIRLAELANVLVPSSPLFEVEDRDVVMFSLL